MFFLLEGGNLRRAWFQAWETREALRQSELRFRTIASESPVILLIADANHVITFIEGKGLDTLKLNPKDVLGRKVTDVFGDVEQLKESSDRAMRGEEFITTLEIKDSVFEVCVSPLRDVDGEISVDDGGVGIFFVYSLYTLMC